MSTSPAPATGPPRQATVIGPTSGAGAVSPPQVAGAAGHPPRLSPTPSRTRSRTWLIGGLVALIVIAAAVLAPLLLLRGKSAPGLPLALRASAGRGTVTLHWQPGSGTTDHYVVYRDGRVIGPAVPSTTFVDRLPNTARHGYAVQAVNAKGATSDLTGQLPAAAQVRALNAAEKVLLGRLPPTLVDDSRCQPILSGVSPHLNLALTCPPGAGRSASPPGVVPRVVEVYSAPSIPQLKAALGAEITTHAARSGSCNAVPQQGTWHFTETPTDVNGQIICYVAASKSYLLWSYEKEKTYIRISTTAAYADLQAYWQDAALRLP